MKFINTLFFLTIFLLNFSCSTAPMIEPHTAKTLGAKNHEVKLAGGYRPLAAVSYTYGVKDSLDLGILIEYQELGVIYGLQGKYRFGAVEKDLSLVFGAGAGTTTYFYVGPVISFVVNPKYEMAFNLRYNYFNLDIDADLDADDSFLSDLVEEGLNSVSGSYHYMSLNFSNTYWLNNQLGFTLSMTGLHYLGIGSSLDHRASLGAHYKF